MSTQQLSTLTRFRFPWRGRELRETAHAPFDSALLSITPDLREREPARTRSAAAGFTIIELMIAVAIVAILVTIAFPSYQEHMRKTRRSAAQTFMMDVASRQQQYLIDARSYAGGATALAALNLAVPGDVSKYYTVSVNPAAPTVPPSYNIAATPIAGSPQAPDGVLTLDHQGSKTRNGQPGW